VSKAESERKVKFWESKMARSEVPGKTKNQGARSSEERPRRRGADQASLDQGS